MIISGESFGGVERLSNVAGVDDCLVSNQEPRLSISVLGMVQVHEQIFVGDGEGGGHAEPKGAGKLDLRELFAVVVVV